MSATIKPLFDYTTNFSSLTHGDIEDAQEKIFIETPLEEGQFPLYTVQIILPHVEHADLDRIYKYIVDGKGNIYTMLDEQAEWFRDLNQTVELAKELAPNFERVRIVYTLC